MSPMPDTARFLRAFLQNPVATGAIAPSSQALGERMVEGADLEASRAVIEYGPGTGSFTRCVLPRLGPQTRFLAVEINPGFAERLRAAYPAAAIREGSVTDIRAICDAEGIAEACCIISGLPWAAFPDRLQTAILEAMMSVLKPGGRFRTFAYLHGLALPAARRFRQKLGCYFREVATSRPVWWNMPPALCYYCIR